ncbi:hypothetical protein LTR56_010772 [Elasticomyces elasticus]|nr:hypothetical protein LTR56_010772 [Elasticomyces elasticus]KAK3667797.1 hypothetical protein LTR22_001242 [Elasticomyces elasticus]KAK4932210.1 hypothetical protein LTR49_001507 [Elasticomyces elasticus]KAK5763410.1 hypothetical protein LTS12_006381 [Elasticomyces elasticus]
MSRNGYPHHQPQQQHHQHFRPPPAPMWFGPNVGQAAPLSSTPRWFGDSVEAFSSSPQHAPHNNGTTPRLTALEQFAQGPRPQLPRSISTGSQYGKGNGQLHGSLVAGDGAFSPPGQYQHAPSAQLPFPSPHSQNLQHQAQPVSQAHYYQLQQTRALASGDEAFSPRAQLHHSIPLARPQFPNLTLSPDGKSYQHDGQQARSLPGVGTVFTPQVPQPRFASLPPDAAFFSRITTQRGPAGVAQQHAPFASQQNGVHHSSDPLVDHDTNYQLRAPSERPRDARLPFPQPSQPASFAKLARYDSHLSSISQGSTASYHSVRQASSTLGQPLQPSKSRDSLSSRLRQDSGYESLYASASVAGSKRSRSCLSSSSASLTDDASSEGEWTSVRSLTPLLPANDAPLEKGGLVRKDNVALERTRVGSVATSSPDRAQPSRHPRKAPSSASREAPKRSNVKIVRPPRKTTPGPAPRRPSKRGEGPKGQSLKRRATVPQSKAASTTPQPPAATQKQGVICSAADIDLDSISAVTPDIVFIDPKFHHSPISVYKLTDSRMACTVITKWLEFCNHEATAPLTLRLEDQRVKLIDQKKPAHLVVQNDAAHFDGEPRRPVVVLAVLIKGDSKIRWYYSDHPSDEVLKALDNKKCLASSTATVEVKPGREKHKRLFVFLRQAFEQAIKIPEHPDFIAAMILTDYSPSITDPDTALERVIDTINSHQTLNSSKITTPHLDRYATYLHPAEQHLCSLVSLSSSAYLLLKHKFFHAFWREVLADYEKIGMGRRKVRTELAHENWLVGYEGLTAKDNSKGSAVGERRLKGREARKLIVGWRVMGLLEETRFLEWAKGGGMLEGVGNREEEKEGGEKEEEEKAEEEKEQEDKEEQAVEG